MDEILEMDDIQRWMRFQRHEIAGMRFQRRMRFQRQMRFQRWMRF